MILIIDLQGVGLNCKNKNSISQPTIILYSCSLSLLFIIIILKIRNEKLETK